MFAVWQHLQSEVSVSPNKFRVSSSTFSLCLNTWFATHLRGRPHCLQINTCLIFTNSSTAWIMKKHFNRCLGNGKCGSLPGKCIRCFNETLRHMPVVEGRPLRPRRGVVTVLQPCARCLCCFAWSTCILRSRHLLWIQVDDWFFFSLLSNSNIFVCSAWRILMK